MTYRCKQCRQVKHISGFPDKNGSIEICNTCQPHLRLKKIIDLDKILRGTSLIFTDLIILYHLHDGDYHVKELSNKTSMTKEALRLRLIKLRNKKLVESELDMDTFITSVYSITDLGKQFVDAAGKEL